MARMLAPVEQNGWGPVEFRGLTGALSAYRRAWPDRRPAHRHLVGTDGTIDWYCCPRFDSPSVFAAILDADRGGLFCISPDCDGWSSKQLYLPDTNVLITRFLMLDGVGEVQDFMPPHHRRADRSSPHRPPGSSRAWAHALRRGRRPALRLRPRTPRGRAH